MQDGDKKLGLGFFSLQGGGSQAIRLQKGNLIKNMDDGRTRVHCPIYTKIKEFKVMDFGVVVREDFFRFNGQSTIYVLDEELEFDRFIHCSGGNDVFSERLIIDGDRASLGSYRGFTFLVDLRTGETLDRALIR